MSEPLMVAWTVMNNPPYDGDYVDWVPVVTTYRGRVLDSVRHWGETFLVVACEDGKVREVKMNEVRVPRFKLSEEPR